MARMQSEDVQALLNLRANLINDHVRMLDGASSPHTAMVKEVDVARCLSAAIRNLEEILATAGDIEFNK